MSEPELTGDVIREAMLGAEHDFCPPADPRCDGFPWGLESALKSRTPAGW
jgi:hypothetical protein